MCSLISGTFRKFSSKEPIALQKCLVYRIRSSSGHRFCGGCSSNKLLIIPKAKLIIDVSEYDVSITALKEHRFSDVFRSEKPFHCETDTDEFETTHQLELIGTSTIPKAAVEKLGVLTKKVPNLMQQWQQAKEEVSTLSKELMDFAEVNK